MSLLWRHQILTDLKLKLKKRTQWNDLHLEVNRLVSILGEIYVM